MPKRSTTPTESQLLHELRAALENLLADAEGSGWASLPQARQALAMTTPYALGKLAGQRREPRRCPPYNDRTDARAWCRGWDFAQRKQATAPTG